MEILFIGAVVILIPLAMAAFGMSLFANSVETISKASKDNKAYKLQRDFYKRNPKATQQDFIDWYIDQKSRGIL